ncbi:Chitin binding domain, partial [Trinorchestia longiramus]
HPENETCVFANDYPECEIIKPPQCECDCLYPSPICSEYFKCVDEKPLRLECPNGLFFNNHTHACDLPENVKCQVEAYRRSGGVHAPAIDGSDCSRLPNGRYAARSSKSDFYHCYRGVGFILK